MIHTVIQYRLFDVFFLSLSLSLSPFVQTLYFWSGGASQQGTDCSGWVCFWLQIWLDARSKHTSSEAVAYYINIWHMMAYDGIIMATYAFCLMFRGAFRSSLSANKININRQCVNNAKTIISEKVSCEAHCNPMAKSRLRTTG